MTKDKERHFYRCVICGHTQEDAEEMRVRCEECDSYEWELIEDDGEWERTENEEDSEP